MMVEISSQQRRQFRDATGACWSVYEHCDPYDRRRTPALVFESEPAIRRVRNYPANWYRLSDDELWTLSWNR